MRRAVNDLYEGNLDGRDVFPRGDPQLAQYDMSHRFEEVLEEIVRVRADFPFPAGDRRRGVTKRLQRASVYAKLDGIRVLGINEVEGVGSGVRPASA